VFVRASLALILESPFSGGDGRERERKMGKGREERERELFPGGGGGMVPEDLCVSFSFDFGLFFASNLSLLWLVASS